jgi:hypothetical protein
MLLDCDVADAVALHRAAAAHTADSSAASMSGSTKQHGSTPATGPAQPAASTSLDPGSRASCQVMPQATSTGNAQASGAAQQGEQQNHASLLALERHVLRKLSIVDCKQVHGAAVEHLLCGPDIQVVTTDWRTVDGWVGARHHDADVVQRHWL